MPKIFYTERDIQDLYENGVSSLVVNDDVVVTDLGREQALKLGFELVREHDQPPSAPVRPYITEKTSPSAAPPASGIAPIAAPISPLKLAKPAPADLESRVFEAVKAKVGDTVDPQLLKTIIRRVVRQIGVK